VLSVIEPGPVLDAFTGGVEVGVSVGLVIFASLVVLAMVRRMVSV